VRVGDWKAVRQRLQPGPRQKEKPEIVTELYHLGKDPFETTNIAAAHPDILQKLEQIMQREHTKSALWPIRALDGE
jgi:arylsulfatase